MNVTLEEFKEGLAKAKHEKEIERKRREDIEYYAYWRIKADKFARMNQRRRGRKRGK